MNLAYLNKGKLQAEKYLSQLMKSGIISNRGNTQELYKNKYSLKYHGSKEKLATSKYLKIIK